MIDESQESLKWNVIKKSLRSWSGGWVRHKVRKKGAHMRMPAHTLSSLSLSLWQEIFCPTHRAVSECWWWEQAVLKRTDSHCTSLTEREGWGALFLELVFSVRAKCFSQACHLDQNGPGPSVCLGQPASCCLTTTWEQAQTLTACNTEDWTLDWLTVASESIKTSSLLSLLCSPGLRQFIPVVLIQDWEVSVMCQASPQTLYRV